MNSNEITQLAMESEDLASGQHRLKVALNTIVMFEGPAVNAEAGGQAEVAIGARDGAGTIADGGFYRARLDHIPTAKLTADEIRRADLEANIARMTALPS